MDQLQEHIEDFNSSADDPKTVSSQGGSDSISSVPTNTRNVNSISNKAKAFNNDL